MARKLASLLDGFVVDPVKNLASGAIQATGGLATAGALNQEVLEKAGNVLAGHKVFDEDATDIRSIAAGLAAKADAVRATVSQDTQAAQQTSTPTGNLFKGEFDLGTDPSARGLVNNIAQGLGSQAPGIAAAVATRGRSLRTQAIAGGVIGGEMGGGFAAQDEGARVRAMHDQDLAALPAYQAALAKGFAPAAAREIVARKAELGAFAATAPVSALGGAATSALFGHAVQGVIAKAAGGGRIATGIASGLVGAGEEGIQEVGEGVSQRVGASAATGEQNRELGQESASNFVLGAAAGGPTGFAAGATSPEAVAHDPAAPQNVQPAQPTVINPSRGVLSRAVAVGASQGHIPNVRVESPEFLASQAPVGHHAPTMPLQDDVAPEIAQFHVQASAQAADRGMPYVATAPDGRALSIKPFDGLKPEARAIEAKAAQQVLSDPDAAVAAYEKLKDTDGGRVISTDEARELFPDYNHGPEGRTANALAVHEPSSFVAKEVWTRKLAQDVAPDRDPLVLFTAGGTGAGKTTAIAKNADTQALYDSADLVYDGNLQSVPSAQEKIEQAIESGRKVSILYVHRDPVDAFANGALPRANREDYGRTVPIPSHASTHIGAAKTIQALALIYDGNPDVSIHMLDNSGAEVPVHDSIVSVAAMQHNDLEEQLHEAARQALQHGIQKRDGSREPLAQRVADYYFPNGEGAQPGAREGLRPAGSDGQDRGAGQGQPGQGQGQVTAAGHPDTPEFHRFFAGSKVVDAQGAPLRVFHGTGRSFDAFSERGASGEQGRSGDTSEGGFFFTADADTASNFAVAAAGLDKDFKNETGAGPNVIPAYLSLKNPKVVTRDDVMAEKRDEYVHSPALMKAAIAQAKAEGHDGLIIRDYLESFHGNNDVRNAGMGTKLIQSADQYVAFEPGQIKSSSANSGAYDPAQPSFLASREPGYNLKGMKPAKAGASAQPHDYGVIVAPKPGTKVTAADGAVRPYDRAADGANLPPAAAPVQRNPDLQQLQQKTAAILKRPAAAAALRKLFGVKAVKLATIRGSYEGVPELSFQLTADGLDGDNAGRLATFLGMAFAQDAVIVTKPDPVGKTEDAIPTLRLYNTDGTKLSAATFDAVTAELRKQGIDYSEDQAGRELRVLHFGDEAGLQTLAMSLATAASAHQLSIDHFYTRSDLHEAPDYRNHLGDGGDQAGAGRPSDLFRALVDHFAVPYARAVAGVGYRFDARRYADRYALAPEELSYLEAGLAKVEPRSSVPLLTGEESVPARGKGRPTNADAAWFMQNRAAALGEIRPTDRSAAAKEAIAETFAQEVEYQIGKPEGKSAIGWYDRQLKNAMTTIASAFPEIDTDPESEFVLKALMAVTSQGLTVELNFNTALKLYRNFKETGKIELRGVTLPGKAGTVVEKNLTKLRKLIEAQGGLAGARNFMRDKHTIRDLKKAGFKDVTGRLDEVVRGWHALGPKIGSFGNNLDGDFDTLTADLWFSRTWNRALGTMFQYSAAREANTVRAFRTEMVKALNEPGYSAVVDALTDAERGRVGEFEADFLLAKRLLNAFARGGYKDKTAINRAAKSWVENVEGLQDVPRGDPERRWQDEVMREVQAKVKARTGKQVAIADLQALLWYQEKELFRILGAANKSSAPLDYQDAAKAAVAQIEGKFLGSKAANPQLDTPAFKKWFGDSKVVGANGQPLVLYHGTRATDFEAFQSTHKDLGMHFGTVAQANNPRFVGDRTRPGGGAAEGSRIVPVYLSLQNPLRMEDKFGDTEEVMWELIGMSQKGQPLEGKITEADIKQMKHLDGREGFYAFAQELIERAGYDGIVYENRGEAENHGQVTNVKDYAYADSYIAFKPTQVKSVNNAGGFDASNPALLASKVPNATVVQAAYPLGTDYLLKTLRRIAPGARIVVAAGDAKSASRIAIDRVLTESESARIAKLAGIRTVAPGTFPTGPQQDNGPGERKVAPRFQVPTSVLLSRDFAALDEDQAKHVDAALGALKTGGYPASWLKNASYFFAHNNNADHVGRLYINGEMKGAISLRQDRMADKRDTERDLAHELAHAADFDHSNGGFHSVMSPRLRIQIGDGGSMAYTGDVIAELHEAWRGSTPLSQELDYPFATAMDSGPDITKAEVFAQSVMLYMTQRTDLKRHAPLTHAMIQEMFANANRPDARGPGALQGALQTTRSRPVYSGVQSVAARENDRQLDPGEQDRPAPDGRAERPGAVAAPLKLSGKMQGEPAAKASKSDKAPADRFFDALDKITTPNPFGGGEQVFMHSGGGAYGSVSVSPIKGDPNAIYLNTIRAFGAGHGYGSYVLGKLTDLADEHGIALELHARPYGTKDMPKAKLVAWYKRHGFKGSSERLVRAPVKAESPDYLASRAPGMPPGEQGFNGYTIPSWEMGDHLSSEAGKRMDGYRGALAQSADKFRTFLQDYFLPVKRIQQAIAERGGTITDETDVYGREETYYGRTGEQLRQLEDDHVKPLVKAMVATKVDQADLELYLYAKFAPARNARIASINPKFPDGGSGMTNADAAQVLADFDAAGSTAKLEALAERVRALNAARLDTLEAGGLLSSGEADMWREERDYVPLKGFAEGIGKPTDVVMPTGKGFSIGGREAHRALGRKSRATDILANTIAQAEQAVIRAEKNRVAIALLRLAEENPNPALWSVDVTPEKPQLSAAGEVTYKKDNRHVLADNVVAVKVAGEQHFVTLHDARLAASMKNLGAAKTGAFLRAFSSVNRFLSLTRTMLAPEFVLANFSRDLQTAAVNLTGDQSAAMAARVVKDVPKAMRAMFGQLRNKSQGGEWSRWAQEFADAGGMTSFVAQYTVEEQQAKIAGLLKQAKGGTPAAIKALVLGTRDLIEDVNGAVENGTRLSAYANARRQGMSTDQAARLAKNLTVNFNRKGQAGPVINSLYLFYNASIQGTVRFLQAMKSPKVQKIMAATAVLGFGLAAYNRAAGGEDDDGEDKWDKIPDWEKARNLIIFLPGGDGAMVKIPLPYTYNLPFLVGGSVESAINSRKPVSSVAATVAEAMLTSFNPLGDVDLHGDSATAAAKLVAPTAVDPLVDLAVNQNFFGAPINPERSPFDKVPEPDSQLAFPSANPAARWIANALNTATGGDALHPGAIDVSPGSMTYVFDYLTGGTGSFVDRLVTATLLAAQGEDVPVRTIPFARVYAGSLDERRVTDTFYRLRDDVNLKAEMAKTGIYATESERQEAMLGRRMAGQLKGTERQLRAIREQRKKAQLLGQDDKVKSLQERERAVQLRFNKNYFTAADALSGKDR